MENSMLLAGGLISIAGHGYSCYNRRKKKQKLYKTKLSSLIMSKGIGKTTLKQSLSSLKSELIIVDLNQVIKEHNDHLEFLQKAKEYVDNLLKQFKDKKFLILCSSQEESKYVGVDILNTFVVCPNIQLMRQILTKCTDQLKKHDVEKEHLKVIRETDKDRLNIFSSYDELYSIIKNEYKLQSSF